MYETITFYIFATIALLAGAGVLGSRNPVKSVLHLIAVMVGVAGLFFNLHSPFLGMVQLLVYAGAVIILFLFVVMIFDVKEESKNIFGLGLASQLLKMLFLGAFVGICLLQVLMRIGEFGFSEPDGNIKRYAVKNISLIMFTDYVFLFEVLGLLLLVIPIGTVALSRIRGGTHDK